MGASVFGIRRVATVALATLLGWASSAAVVSAATEPSLLLEGAGATFPAPLYHSWIKAYADVAPAVRIAYRPVGSGEGIKRFLAGEVDFGASDAALSDEQLAVARDGVKMVPATAGMVALAYNLPGLTEPLKLKRDVYADIMLGKIRKWNDPRITASNPGIPLPSQDIVRVVRKESSGTTYAFTNHLSAISDEWRDRGPGTGKVIDWPGNAMTAAGNEGVAARINISVGSIGYVEYGQAKRLGLALAVLENSAGQFVAPSEGSGQRALTNSLGEMPDNLRLFLPDPKGEDSYPIVTYSWLLLRPHYEGAGRAAAVRNFVHWALTEGQAYSREFGFVPLPEEIADLSRAAVASIR